MKKIFSNTWFKCIVFLLVLMAILGGTLAVLNDALFVPPKERALRAINKIYGKDMNFTVEMDVDAGDKAIKSQNGFGTINKIYNIEEDILFQATGVNGYKNGTITLWIRVIKEANRYSIEKIVLETYEKQTLMSRLDNSFYKKFYIDVTNNTDFFSADSKVSSPNKNLISGATYSANAACNAVNCVMEYLGGK